MTTEGAERDTILGEIRARHAEADEPAPDLGDGMKNVNRLLARYGRQAHDDRATLLSIIDSMQAAVAEAVMEERAANIAIALAPVEKCNNGMYYCSQPEVIAEESAGAIRSRPVPGVNHQFIWTPEVLDRHDTPEGTFFTVRSDREMRRDEPECVGWTALLGGQLWKVTLCSRNMPAGPIRPGEILGLKVEPK